MNDRKAVPGALVGPLRKASALLLCLGLSAGALAQNFPDRPIHMLIGFAPGGGGDIVGRVLSQKLSDRLKVAVPFENRPGANGVIAAGAVARSKPDGYTLFLITSSHVLNGVTQADLPYDTLNDFSPITQIARTTFVLVMSSSIPARTLPEFVALAKAAPGKYNFASTGVGGGTHLAGQAFLTAAGINMVHVPYQGAGAAVTAVRTGEVSAFVGSTVGLAALVDNGPFRLLGVTTQQRSPALPNVPTMREQGVDVDMSSYYGILAPAKTPADVVKKLNEALVAVIRDPDMVERLAKDGAAPVGNSPAEFAAFLAADLKRMAPLVKAAGLAPAQSQK